MRSEDLGGGTKYPTTLCKWCNKPGERGPFTCAHGGTSDRLSRCIIKSKCIGNDAFGNRKSRDTLFSQ